MEYVGRVHPTVPSKREEECTVSNQLTDADHRKRSWSIYVLSRAATWMHRSAAPDGNGGDRLPPVYEPNLRNLTTPGTL